MKHLPDDRMLYKLSLLDTQHAGTVAPSCYAASRSTSCDEGHDHATRARVWPNGSPQFLRPSYGSSTPFESTGTTREDRRRNANAAPIGDVLHLVITIWALGDERWDFSQWGGVLWATVLLGFTLMIPRITWHLGIGRYMDARDGKNHRKALGASGTLPEWK